MTKLARWTGFSVDIEANGPIPGPYSMIEIGIVKIDMDLKTTFSSHIKPLNDKFVQEALDSIGVTHEQTMLAEAAPESVMQHARQWVMAHTREGEWPMMFSDNNGFDFMFTHWYFENFLGVGNDPFGHTSRNISDLYRGLKNSVKARFRHLRETKHTHNAVDDAMGNAEAVLKMVRDHGLEGLNIS